jgi:transposase
MKPLAGPKLKLDDTKRKRALAWARVGTSLTEAAEYFGVGRDTLRRYLRGEQKNLMRQASR